MDSSIDVLLILKLKLFNVFVKESGMFAILGIFLLFIIIISFFNLNRMLGRKIKMGNSQPSNEPLKQDLYTIQTTSYDKISYLSNQNFSQNAITTNRPNISPTYGGINYSNQASGESSTSNSNFQNKKISTQDTTSTLESKIFGLLQKIDGKIDRLEKRVNNIEEETLSKFSLFEQNKTSLEESGIPKYLQEIDEKVTRLGRKFEGWELGSSQPSFVKDINNKLEIMEGRTDSWGKEVEKRKKMKFKLILYEDLEIKDQQTLIKWLENQDDKTKKKMKFSVSHNLDLISTKSKILFPIKIGKNFISTEFFNKVSDYIMKYQRNFILILMCQENAYPEDIEFLKLWWSKFIVFKDNKIEDSSLSIIDKANQETNLSSLYGFDKKSEAQNYLTSRKTFNIQEIKDREKEEESHKILKRALIICKQSEFNFMDELKNLFSPYKEAIFTQDLNEKFNPKDYDLIYIVLKQTGRFDDNVILFVQQIREKIKVNVIFVTQKGCEFKEEEISSNFIIKLSKKPDPKKPIEETTKQEFTNYLLQNE